MSHSKLSASESHRWMRCPGSCRACKGLKQKPNAAATKGTATHHVGAQVLRGYVGEENGIHVAYEEGKLLGYSFSFEDSDENGEVVMKQSVVDEPMLAGVELYVDHVMAALDSRPGSKLYVEERLLLDHVFPDMGGTADVMIDDPIVLTVIDYKNGITPVILVYPGYDPQCPDFSLLNSQLLMYGAGAAHRFKWMHDWVTIQVVQPNCFSVADVQSVTVPAALLKEWMETELKEAAEATEDPEAPLVPGDQCDWCVAAPFCTALRAQLREAATTDFDGIDDVKPELLTEDQSLDILEWGPRFEALYKRVKAIAFEKLQRGQAVKGYKLVRTNPNRAWPDNVLDSTKLMKRLREAGAEIAGPDSLYEHELMSPAQVERLLGNKKKHKDIVNKVAIRPIGELTLTVVTNPKPAVTPSNGLSDIIEEA